MSLAVGVILFAQDVTFADSYEHANGGDVNIPSNGSWVGSVIDFSALPPDLITGIDIHYEIKASQAGLLYADLADDNDTYHILTGHKGSIVADTHITAFNGKPLNQAWVLWAKEESSSGGGYIDYWRIKVYYNSISPYCGAATLYPDEGGEYISRVAVGSIDKSSGSSGYADYTGLSATVPKGIRYPVTVTNGALFYPTDECGIWVDWNQDNDFDDAGETISVWGSPGVGPYTASITPPVGAVSGGTRMRVRIVDTSIGNQLSPCDLADYGEVEDYTINVADGIAGDFAAPVGVDFIDLSIFAEQWLLETLPWDIAPDGGDGIVNFLDWAVFAGGWDGNTAELAEFASEWLESGAYCADIAPGPNGDKKVNIRDFAVFAENWLRK